ncbi:tetratricopeptide repeat protein [Massilia horti]|uniref:Tetratricopeptide repeat protein n=1 Tax=Massilia horti TaxID=2562153 RepID=A0A4Y9T1T3_9BURK|nr:tetratricopeptide repeat protein [Massilia horti]TFW33374.1 tetratricopeptide repeat protein [Massilia horti]
MFKHVLPGLVCVAFLSACASGGQSIANAPKPPTIAEAMAQADAAVMAGQNDKAYTILKSTSATFPTEKTPWVRMAQMRFDSGNYGEAIVNALEALSRDPDDTLAHSIVAVSGLRVTSKALADLSQKNNITGNVRSEAQDLAKLLRASLGQEELVPGAARTVQRKEQPKRAISAPASKPPATANNSSDPFGALK